VLTETRNCFVVMLFDYTTGCPLQKKNSLLYEHHDITTGEIHQ